jgi:predicted small secreted protein
MTTRHWIAVVVMGAAFACGCHNTAQGIKDDTRNAVQKTGQGVEKTGQKIENAGKK